MVFADSFTVEVIYTSTLRGFLSYFRKNRYGWMSERSRTNCKIIYSAAVINDEMKRFLTQRCINYM